MNKHQLIKLEDKYNAHNYKPLDIIIKKGHGSWVWDIDNKKYLDLLSAYSALNFGHCHHKLVNIARKQISQLTLTSRAFRNEQLANFCEEICKFTGFEKVLPMNTGAEAVETAIKAVRKWAYTKKKIALNKAEIIVMKNNFHGRTTTIVSFSDEPQYKKMFGPHTPGFKIVEYNHINDLKKAVNKNTAAILMEPIQGEAGVIIPDKDYLKKVRELCTKNNVLLVLDEIQSGFGRTGKLFAYEHAGIKPDALIIGKALTGGIVPMSAFLSNKAVMDVFQPGDHGSTYGGNPVACAVAREVIKLFNNGQLLKNVKQLSQYSRDILRSHKSKYIKHVRIIGLWIAIEFNNKAKSARYYCEQLEKQGILCKEAHENIIRIAPPLNISKKDLDFGLKKILNLL